MPGRPATRTTGAGRSTRSTRAKKEAATATVRPATPESDKEEEKAAENDGEDSSLRRQMCALFFDSQKTLAGHRKLVVSLRRIQEMCCYEPVSAAAASGMKRNDEDFEETDFNAEFTRCITRILPIRKSESAADRVVRFMTSFLRYATEKDTELIPEEDRDEAVETPTSRLTNEILSIVVPLLLAKDKFVRYRATQIVRHVVGSLESIDDDVYHLLRAGLLKRVRDKEAMVRVQAILGLTHLIGNDEGGGADEDEDEDDDDGRDVGLLGRLIDVLQNDPSPDVRKTLLLNLPLTPTTLPFLLERARDVDPATRRALYSKLLPALGDFRHLSLSMREKLLRWGLRDRDDSVHNATARLFRERWIEDIAGSALPEEEQKPGQAAPANVDSLLELIERIDIINSGMEEGVGIHAFNEFWEGRPDYVEAVTFEDPFWDELTAESAFMVRSFNDFCRKDEKRWGETLEEKMPEVTKLAFMLERYSNLLMELLRNPDHTDEEVIEPEFIVEQLLHITETLDYADEIGRRKMFSLLREMIATPELPEEITRLAIGVLRNVCGGDMKGERDFCGVVLEAIAEVHDTIADPEEDMMDPDDSFHSARSQQTDDTITAKSALKPMIRNNNSSGDDTAVEDQQKVIKEIMVNMKCLHIAQCMLQNAGGNLQANIHLVTMLNNLVVPAVRSHEAPIRERGLQCLGLCCLLDKQLAEENLTLFLHCYTKGHPALQIHALETLTDIMAVWPSLIAPVSPGTPTPGATHASTEDSTESPNLRPLLKAFTKAIRPTTNPLVLASAVTCLSKLYLTNTVTDDGLLQALLQTFFDPAIQDNHAARQALSYFIPAFAHSRRENMEAVGRIAPDVVKSLVSMHDEFIDDGGAAAAEDQGIAAGAADGGIISINTAVAMLADWTDTRRLVAVIQAQEAAAAGKTPATISLLDNQTSDSAEKQVPMDGNVHLDLIAEALERASARGAEKDHRRALLSLVAKLTVIPESDATRLEEAKQLVDDVVDAKLATETASKNALVKMQLALYKAIAAKKDAAKAAEEGDQDGSAVATSAATATAGKKGKGRAKKGAAAANEDAKVVQSIETGEEEVDDDDDDDDGTSTIKGADDDDDAVSLATEQESIVGGADDGEDTVMQE